jgi:hypothetical protein
VTAVTARPRRGAGAVLCDGRLALLAGLVLLVVLAVGLGPTILREETRDWIAYDQAADRLAAGEPLYVFELATPDDEYYLYPPPAAAIWGAFPSPDALLVLKVVALAAAGTLALVAWPAARSRERVALAGALAAAALVAAPNLHDLVLGNVMALYVGAVAISLARPGWLGAVPLGIVCAAALKPVIGPYLLWLLVRRRADAGRVVAVGLALTAVFAVLLGPGRYVEYLVALPRMSVLVDLPSGNVGLSVISREVAIVGVAAAYVATGLAALRFDRWRAAAIAIAAGLLAQPSLGFNYAGLLLPAVVALWAADRVAGFVAVVTVPLVAVLSPPLASLVIVGLAVVGLEGRMAPAANRSGAVGEAAR